MLHIGCHLSSSKGFAAMGRQALELGADADTYRGVAKMAAADDLMKLKTALETRLAETLPVVTQLGSGVNAAEAVESGFLI